MMIEIKPHIDSEGVGRCDEGCPQYSMWAHAAYADIDPLHPLVLCGVDELAGDIRTGDICPHHTAKMAALLRKIEAVDSGYWTDDIRALIGEEE